MIMSENYTEAVDIFSFSVLCYVLLCEDFFPYGPSVPGIEMKVANNPNFRADLKNLANVGVSKAMILLVRACWDHQPHRRPSSLALHKILKNVSKLNESCFKVIILREKALPFVEKSSSKGVGQTGGRLRYVNASKNDRFILSNFTYHDLKYVIVNKWQRGVGRRRRSKQVQSIEWRDRGRTMKISTDEGVRKLGTVTKMEFVLDITFISK